MRTTVSVVVLLVAIGATKVHAQTRVLTNADLGQHRVTRAAPPSAETMQGLTERQFHFYPRSDGPVVASTGSRGPSSGPWDWPEPSPMRRLDGSLVTDPINVYGASLYFFPGAFYGGVGVRHHHPDQHRRQGSNQQHTR